MVDLRPPPTIVSFTAQLISQNRDDALREFIVAYWVDTKQFSVVEKVVPNSGFPGGKFLQKTLYNNPDTGVPYEPDQVTIGKDVILGGWHFHLTSATEGSLKTMEARTDLFTRSDLYEIIEPLTKQLKGKANDLKTAFMRRDKQRRGRIHRNDLGSVLEDFRVRLGEQELVTLFRRFQFADSDMFEYNDFLTLFK